uniref:Uncharacterized protein n=1 Tax=Balbiania investiens TaxID=111861 RepID=A0A4D6BL89_9FLOR|nr:hypothetical protein [Balbiania investiens]QBX88692.1 hypothetical protein [Balbiania investiens]
MSWIPHKNINEMRSGNDEEEMNNDQNKIFTREIDLAILQEDGLEWIENVCSKDQQKELLENIEIIAAAIYPKSLRKRNFAEMYTNDKKHEGNNNCRLEIQKINSKVVSIEEECYEWTSVNMVGDLLVNKLLELRQR